MSSAFYNPLKSRHKKGAVIERNGLFSGVLSPGVDVLDSDYKWKGELYPTLTHISWKATGYQIGGNNFFGLPSKRKGE